MRKTKKLVSNWRIWVYVLFFALMIVAIHPNPMNHGVTIRNVIANSSAYNAGILSAKPDTAPMSRERILTINNQPILNTADYENIVGSLTHNRSVSVLTNQRTYILRTAEDPSADIDFGITVYDAPKSNIKMGLDLQGGTRVVLQPEEKISADDLDSLIANMNQRLNVFGLSDVVIRGAGDLSGNQFIVVEVAGANEDEVKDLLSSQGKFEAKIGNTTVFRGGKQDLTHVCTSGDCSGIDPRYGCRESGNGWTCRFYFSITLSPEAAQRQANTTQNLEIVVEGRESYLEKDLDLYLDDSLVDTLKIGSELRGKPSTQIQISGSGAAATQRDAIFDSLQNMKRLRTVLITGSLPVKLKIIKSDTISPVLGREFLTNAILIGLLSIIAVNLIVYLRYRRIKISIPISIVITSEIILILGVTAFLGQNLDIAGIAGIIVAIGTGVDDQIIITDETLRKEKEYELMNWRQKLGRAFFMVVASYFATSAAMVPLLFAGAGLLKGFAVTTMIGVTIGVLITRPAFAEMIEILVEDV